MAAPNPPNEQSGADDTPSTKPATTPDIRLTVGEIGLSCLICAIFAIGLGAAGVLTLWIIGLIGSLVGGAVMLIAFLAGLCCLAYAKLRQIYRCGDADVPFSTGWPGVFEAVTMVIALFVFGIAAAFAFLGILIAANYAIPTLWNWIQTLL